MNIDIINLQAHDVIVFPSETADPIMFPSQGPVQVRMEVSDVTPNGLIKTGNWTHTRNLPAPQENTLYIVSALVAMFELHTNNRTDLLFPWGMIKEKGRIIGCKALCNPR